MKKDNIQCRMGFYVYQVVLFSRTLWLLGFFEEMLNKNKKTLQPIDKIKKLHARMDGSIEDFNLRNPYALMRRKYYYLTSSEWNILQNSLCCSLGMHEQYDLFSKKFLEMIKKLHSRFEKTLDKTIAGYRGRGYKINEEALEDYKLQMINHEPDKAIKPLLEEVNKT